MGKTSGCVLILAGLAVGAYALYAEPVTDTAAAQSGASGRDSAAAVLSALMRVAGAPVPAAEKPVETEAAPAPQLPQPSVAPKPAPEPSKDDGSGAKGTAPPVPGLAPPVKLVPPVPVPAKRPRTAVTSVEVNEAPPRVPVGDPKTAERPPTGAALTREIQLQLKRVGCYRGEVSGVWTTSVRQAMRDFTERVNASLPVDGPDPVLLAMLQSSAPDACSEACPPGQDRAAGGRCVPSVLAAVKGRIVGKSSDQAKAAKASRGDTGKAKSLAGSVPSGSPPTQPTDGRMSLAGPPVAGTAPAKRPQAAVRRQPRVAGWSRSAQGRSRRAYRQPTYKGYSGLPSWALPFMMP